VPLRRAAYDLPAAGTIGQRIRANGSNAPTGSGQGLAPEPGKFAYLGPVERHGYGRETLRMPTWSVGGCELCEPRPEADWEACHGE
jgi:hypothetical protein